MAFRKSLRWPISARYWTAGDSAADDLNHLAKITHEANQKWWLDLKTGAPLDRNIPEMLMLIVSEIAEAMEGHRKDLIDDKLPKRKM